MEQIEEIKVFFESQWMSLKNKNMDLNFLMWIWMIRIKIMKNIKMNKNLLTKIQN